MSDGNEERRRLASTKRREKLRRLLSKGRLSPCASRQVDPRSGGCFYSHRTIGERRDRIVSKPEERQKTQDALAARRFGNAG